MKPVLVTGAEGFIGRNLCVRLRERGDCEVLPIGRGAGANELGSAVRKADFVFHLAGVNRPEDPAEFDAGNAGVTAELCRALAEVGNDAPIVFSSSIQAEADNPYGASKRDAESALLRHSKETGAQVALFRLANVFGKWARPNYNSAVATFCHAIARGEPIHVHDPAAPLRLVYVDDVVDAFLRLLDEPAFETGYYSAEPVYQSTVGEVARLIRGFPATRDTLVMPAVGGGFMRALYSTYLSYLEPDDFHYSVPIHSDPRGVFVEMLKNEAAGQLSYFTAKPGITRGDHYHHSKVEKFLVLAGTARFAFRQILSGERYEVTVGGGDGRIVETIPGWAHNVTNVGSDELVVMLWANEIFDRDRPDTVIATV